jgi:hypothetical protein
MCNFSHVAPYEARNALQYLVCFACITSKLTPRCRVLLENLGDLKLVKKFPAFYRNRSFITPFTSPRHLALS